MYRHTQLTEGEIETILKGCDEGLNLRQIACSVNRSCYAIQCCLRKHGKKVCSVNKNGIGAKKLPEVMDYSRLSDNILFNPKLYPVF